MIINITTIFSKQHFDDYLNVLFSLSEDSLKYYESGIVRFDFNVYRNDLDIGATIGMKDQATGKMLLRLTGLPKTAILDRNITGSLKFDYLMEILDRTEDQMLDLELFRYFSLLDDAKKLLRKDAVIKKLKENSKYVYKPDEAKKALKKIGFLEDVPPGPNGLAPDYSSLVGKKFGERNVVYQGTGDSGKVISGIIIDFPYTSSRSKDFELAYKKLGLTSKEIEKIEREYVWHHLDDFDPSKGTGTMQLVLKDVHNSSYLGKAMNHTGGVAIWAYYYQIFYR